jgi:hypothetical protein
MSEFGFKITSTANQKIIQFLDVTLDLNNESFKPFIKPGDTPNVCEQTIQSSPCSNQEYPAGS